jgi:hypothetical protein
VDFGSNHSSLFGLFLLPFGLPCRFCPVIHFGGRPRRFRTVAVIRLVRCRGRRGVWESEADYFEIVSATRTAVPASFRATVAMLMQFRHTAPRD